MTHFRRAWTATFRAELRALRISTRLSVHIVVLCNRCMKAGRPICAHAKRLSKQEKWAERVAK